ncbi:MAG: acyl-CoA thioester hydrolase/BAAT C-terminal domain-containing protein [Chitinophagaceae bacterium]
MRQLFFLIGLLLPIFSFSQTEKARNDSVITVRDNGLVANFYLPKTSGKHPAIIVIGGSEGGIWWADAWGEPLSTRGYAVLSLAYFDMEKLPTQLEEIPLEYFKKAIDWVSAHPAVDPKRIAFAGVSKGGEAVLLIAAIYPEVKAVVAGVPSHVVWQSINWQSLNKKEKPTTKSSWTLQGKALPFVPYDTTQKFTSLLDFYVGNLRDLKAVEAAIIPVEKIKAPILLISGKDDKMWPSTLMAEQVVDRLKNKKFGFSYEHLSYDNAGHAITGPPRKSSPVSVIPAADTSSSPRPIWQMGGTPEGNTLARNDAWTKIIKFLDKSLPVVPIRKSTRQKVQELKIPSIKQIPIVYYSPGYKKRGEEVSGLLAGARQFYEHKLQTKVDFNAAVLTKSQWEQITRIPYGIPFASDPPFVAFLPATDGILTTNIKQAKELATPAYLAQLKKLGYSFEEAERMGVDLIGLHEVGHIYSESLGIVSFPPTNKWLSEFVATYFAYTYMREKHPKLAALWDVGTENGLASMPKQKYTSLQDFEKLYSDVGPENYGWFQSKFSQLAKQIYEAKGFSFIETLRKNSFPEKNAIPIEDVLQRLEILAPGFIAWAKQFE